MASQNLSSIQSVIITDSTEGAYYNGVPSSRLRKFNEELPAGSCGIYIGESGNFNLFVIKSGDNDGTITPYIGIAGGVIHPISARQIVSRNVGSVGATTARHIVVEY